ncbi:transposase, partial [Corynebacterium striatum]
TRTNTENRRADSVGPAPVPTTRNPAVPGLRNTGTQNPHLTVTDAVLDEVMVWQNRQLDEFYPVVFLDALRIKVRDDGRVVNKSAYMAIGVDLDGIKHILGLWIAKEEGASFWAQVCANLSNRGVKDVFIVCCDGLKGLPEAVEATWPNSMVQTCIVHLIRAANRWVA